MLSALGENGTPCELYAVHGHYADAGEARIRYLTHAYKQRLMRPATGLHDTPNRTRLPADMRRGHVHRLLAQDTVAR